MLSKTTDPDTDEQKFLLKVADFGLSNKSSATNRAKLLPIMWCAPEILNLPETSRGCTDNYKDTRRRRSDEICKGSKKSGGRRSSTPFWTKEADVWSFGILLWEIYHGAEKPYRCGSMEVLRVLIATQGLKPKIGAHVPKSVAFLMSICWSSEAKFRPDFKTICHRLDFQSESGNPSVTPIRSLIENLHDPFRESASYSLTEGVYVPTDDTTGNSSGYRTGGDENYHNQTKQSVSSNYNIDLDEHERIESFL